MNTTYTVTGFLVGGVVGMTGVGGGSLMTPILVLLFGYAPQTAIGTDLLFACVTKSVGLTIHGRQGTVDWQVLGRLSCGSIPAALATGLWMYGHPLPPQRSGALIGLIGAAIILTAVGLCCKPLLLRPGLIKWAGRQGSPMKHQVPFTVAAGAVVGVLVSLTSIGAGVLGTVMLIYLYPLRMRAARLVGTDIAHAIPLTLVAGVGNLFMGNVDLELLGGLLTGSIPGIILGSLAATRAPETLVRNALAAVLLLVGLKMALA
ncbi:MAG: sulfite exporter TauE/SafE family protein [Oryzomonas sp.]|uniref:sulfite exporter TauE/SafE family protein n=1 Tax=Oryzomonas sp. TaxID=2855186 RepID=UPI002847CA19|nr:sulfite exporter TauE/SafE family protein [Oryzomonas sp.]MDR3578417.1 sulfite exporter TauE/SafE family protein [Oryzomonas sp.]